MNVFAKLTLLLTCLPFGLEAQYYGFNNTNPLGPLSLRNGLGAKVLLWGADAYQNNYGFGNIDNNFRFHTDASFAHIGFGVGRSGAFTEVMRINNSTGNVGIGTTSPTQVLDVNGTFRMAPYDSFTTNKKLYGPSWVYFANAANTGTPVKLGSIANVSRFSNVYSSYSGFFRHSDGRLMLGTNANGALYINGKAGTAGQVLTSNDYYGEATWRTTSSAETYNNSDNAVGESPVTLSNSVETIGLMRPGDAGTAYGNTFQLAYPSKVIMRFTSWATVTDCCGPSVYDVQVVVNGNVVRTFRFSVENGGSKQGGASTMLTLNPGTYQFGLRAYRVSGPNINLSWAPDVHAAETSIVIIPNPYY